MSVKFQNGQDNLPETGRGGVSPGKGGEAPSQKKSIRALTKSDTPCQVLGMQMRPRGPEPPAAPGRRQVGTGAAQSGVRHKERGPLGSQGRTQEARGSGTVGTKLLASTRVKFKCTLHL